MPRHTAEQIASHLAYEGYEAITIRKGERSKIATNAPIYVYESILVLAGVR